MKRMVEYIKFIGKMRVIAGIFVLTVMTMNLLITGTLAQLQYASAIGDNIQVEQGLFNETSDSVGVELTEEKEVVEVNQQEKIVNQVNNVKTVAKTKVTNLKLNSQGGLLETNKPDKNYSTKVVGITGVNRDNLERLVMGEAGGEGFEGACLVAQAIKDTMLLENNYNVKSIKKLYRYSASLEHKPSQDVINAVRYIFDDGGYAVKHRIIYFYAPRWVKNNWSGFHESQNFIIKWGGHKFFDLAK